MEPRPAARRAFLVLGMHRSGTSALTRVLSLCGVALPQHLIPASGSNERGYFESRTLWALHERMLDEMGTSWHDPSPIPAAWFESPAADEWVGRLANAVRQEFGDSERFVLKDPRLCRLVPLWRRVLAEVGALPACVLVVRHPAEVTASLRRAEGMPEALGDLLWLDHLLAAERDTRDMPRTFVSYDDLLEDWRAVVERIAMELGTALPRGSRLAEAEVEAFLAPELRHHRQGPIAASADTGLHPWLARAWDWACAAAAGRPSPPALLDALRVESERAESAWGPALAALAVDRTRNADEAHAQIARARELERALEEEQRIRTDLREQLTARREEVARLSDVSRMLLRWVVERGRGNEPAPPPLRAALETFAAAHPLETPALASAAMQIADQRLELKSLERERAERAAEIERLATRVTVLEDRLVEREREGAHLAGELGRCRVALAAREEELVRAEERMRELSADAACHASESERLARECGRWMQQALARRTLEDDRGRSAGSR